MGLDKEKVYKQVDIQGLAECLAHDAFKEETKNISEEDLYQTIIVPGAEAPLQRQIRPYWATSFFHLKEMFLQLIHQFVKN